MNVLIGVAFFVVLVLIGGGIAMVGESIERLSYRHLDSSHWGLWLRARFLMVSGKITEGIGGFIGLASIGCPFVVMLTNGLVGLIEFLGTLGKALRG